MRKLLLLITALLTLGVSGAWADVTVTLSNQSDLDGITDDASSSEATATHKYGVYSGSDAENTPYYTTFTTNGESGLAGVTLSTTAKIMKPTFVGGQNVAHYGHLIAINYDKADQTVYTFTITAPAGYYIKSYAFTALSTSDNAPFNIIPLGGSTYTAKGYLYKKNVTATVCASTATFTVQRTTNNNANYLCIPTFTVTLASTTMSGDATLAINNTTGSGTRADGSAPGISNFRTWTSTSAPVGVTLQTASGNDLNYNATEVIMHSAGGTYTLTAPDGYLIKGYKMEVYSSNRNTIQPAGASVKTELSGDSGNKTIICVDDINTKSTTFTRGYITSAAYANAVMTVYLKESTVKITYVVKNSAGTEIFRSNPIDIEPGTAITTLPSEFKRDFCSYNEVSETADVTKEINFTATYEFPFEISETYAGAHWYDMSIRSTWYVTSDKTEGGALKTVNANALGLATDPYQWAFVGNPYNLKLYNKDKGEDYVYAWTAASNENIPTFVDATTGNSWTIKRSTATGYTNAFMLTIPDYGYQVNQFGGEGGSLKIWSSTTTADAGSAFKVFDVPDDFAEYVTSEIAPYMENSATYFNWTDAARTAIGYNASYKTTCTYAKYAEMKNALTTALSDLSDKVNYPPTGYYRLHNLQHTTKYLGQEGLLAAFTDKTKANTVVKLTKHPTTNTYTIQIQGKYIQAPDGISSGGYQVETGNSEVWFTPRVKEIGYAAFSAGTSEYNYIHCNGSSAIVGWDSGSNASHWAVEDAPSFTGTLTNAEDNSGTTRSYATLCVPFNITGITGASAYIPTIDGSYLAMGEGATTIAAGTPVILVGEENAGSYTATIGDTYVTSSVAASGSNALSGTFTSIALNCTAATGTNYVLGFDSDNGNRIGFYHVNNATFPLSANRAYLTLGGGNVKGFAISFDETSVTSLKDEQTKDNAIFNLAGQRVSKPTRGLYIVGGKKVVVK